MNAYGLIVRQKGKLSAILRADINGFGINEMGEIASSGPLDKGVLDR
ncbi:MAG: hypothetical protein WB341_13745 [Terracidiphilus sp.]